MSKYKLIYLLLIFSLMISLVQHSGQATTNLMTNGSFENNGAGWTTNDVFEIWTYGAPDGNKLIELNGNKAGTIYQIVNVTGGQAFSFSFQHKARANNNESIQIKIINQDTQETIYSGTSYAVTNQWRTYTAVGELPDNVKRVKVQIQSMVNGSVGNLIDNVIFTTEPLQRAKVYLTTDKSKYVAGDTIHLALQLDGSDTITNGGIDTGTIEINYTASQFEQLNPSEFIKGLVDKQTIEYGVNQDKIIVYFTSTDQGVAGNITEKTKTIATLDFKIKTTNASADINFSIGSVVLLRTDTTQVNSAFIGKGSATVPVLSRSDNATSKVIDAEKETSTIADLEAAQGLVDILPDGQIKNELQNRVDLVYSILHAKPQIQSDVLYIDENTKRIMNFNVSDLMDPERMKSNLSKNRNVSDILVTKIANGQTVKIKGFDGQITEYTIIIYGDTDPDGDITVSDYMEIKKHILGLTTISEELKKIASDVDGDGTINVADLMKIKKQIQGKFLIVQS